MRSTIGLWATFGTFAGSFVPDLWGGSELGLASVVLGALGGVAGVWLGVRLSD
jgi:hypothetical protein